MEVEVVNAIMRGKEHCLRGTAQIDVNFNETWFQEDEAMAQTARETMNILINVFHNA